MFGRLPGFLQKTNETLAAAHHSFGRVSGGVKLAEVSNQNFSLLPRPGTPENGFSGAIGRPDRCRWPPQPSRQLRQPASFHSSFCILHSAFVRTYLKNVPVPLPDICGICRCVGS